MKIDRLVSIIMILLDKKRIGAQELAEMFEVSTRTIYRDIDAINMAGIPVHGTAGVGGGFEIMPNYKVDKNVFSAEELSAILTGLFGLSGMMQGNEPINTLAKIRGLIPADKVKEIELKAEQIHIDLSPWMGNRSIQPHLENIKTALQESRLLSFEYLNLKGNKIERTVEPYQLVLKSGHWYLQGYCYVRNGFRLFRLSRMLRLRIETETFTPRDYPKPKLDAADMLEAMQTGIGLRIHSSILERALDYCAYEKFVPDGEDHYVVDFPFIENEYYYDILLGFGDKCECLEPPHIRAELRRRIQSIAAIYEG